LRAADSRPVEIQDLLPSDARFKLLVFTGDSSCPLQLEKVREIADELDSVLTELTAGRIFEFFDILSISAAKKTKVRYNELPALLRSHWSKCVSSTSQEEISPDDMIVGFLSMISTLVAAREVMDTRITELVRMVWLSSAQMDMLGWSRHSTIRLKSAPISKHSSGRTRKSKCGFIYRM